MPQAGTPLSLTGRVLKAAPLIVAISLVTLGLEWLGWLDHFETAGRDSALLLREPREPSVVVILISDTDYSNLFHNRSPLDYQEIGKIIGAVASGGASAIAVDIDTSAAGSEKMARPPNAPPIVWGADATQTGDDFKPFPVLSGSSLTKTDRVGIAVIQPDSDGLVRHYTRAFRVAGQPQPSFPWAAVQSFCRAGPKSWNCDQPPQSSIVTDHPIWLNFTGARYDKGHIYTAGQLIQDAGRTSWGHPQPPFRGRIVVIGGSFRAARDSFATPVGEMPGAYVMAQAMESELSRPVGTLSWLIAIVLDIIVGFVIVLINFYFPLRPAVLISLIAIPALSLTSSLLAFSTYQFWFNFVPMIVAVFIHELYHHAVEYQRLSEAHEKVARRQP